MSHKHLVAGPRHIILHNLPALVAGLVLVLLAVMMAGVSVGAVGIPLNVVWGVIVNHLAPGSVEVTWSAGRDNIVWEVRLPRVILGGIVGATLAVVGAALQSVTRNQLADPHLLGISSGAALGAIVVLLHTGMFLGLVTVPLFAFVGALATTAIVVGVASFTKATDASRLVLIGVAVSFVVTSLGSLGIFLGDPRAAHTVIFWMLGGLGLSQWEQLPYPLAALAAGSAYLMFNARNLNAMTLGDESATALGLPASGFRIVVFIVCALLTGAAVAFSGVISFIGLMIPHLVRLVVGGDYRRVLPLSALVGAIFLVLADMAARVIIPPQDMPLGVITGLVGGLFFIVLMRRNGRLG
ncbi:FecCD family ABC transporter permease [Pelagibacterium xiamenense]|uniref:FecCD family ABC transporter permease n=1 Tax=Pelagibacterium xiamenense TaxID=2901140 RepID=UPI001E3BA285|nr:iron ABC transporter permease [Pelagibacterium xiamenense]MCD7059395.1 iron ABC transporter permease [Pelagibacterium xiamenense]